MARLTPTALAGLLGLAALPVGYLLLRRWWLTPLNRLGRTIYADDLEATDNLHSPLLGLAGRPDRVVLVWRPFPEERPVEIKSFACPEPGPRPQDVVQLVFEAQLVAATWGRFPRAGYICYAPPDAPWKVFRIPLGPDAEALSLRLLAYHHSLACAADGASTPTP